MNDESRFSALEARVVDLESKKREEEHTKELFKVYMKKRDQRYTPEAHLERLKAKYPQYTWAPQPDRHPNDGQNWVGEQKMYNLGSRGWVFLRFYRLEADA